MDGRGCEDYRHMEIETDVVSNTDGSAKVTLVMYSVSNRKQEDALERFICTPTAINWSRLLQHFLGNHG